MFSHNSVGEDGLLLSYTIIPDAEDLLSRMVESLSTFFSIGVRQMRGNGHFFSI